MESLVWNVHRKNDEHSPSGELILINAPDFFDCRDTASAAQIGLRKRTSFFRENLLKLMHGDQTLAGSDGASSGSGDLAHLTVILLGTRLFQPKNSALQTVCKLLASSAK